MLLKIVHCIVLNYDKEHLSFYIAMYVCTLKGPTAGFRKRYSQPCFGKVSELYDSGEWWTFF